jgi:hypothetical protein
VKKKDSSSNTVTITASGSDKIDGLSSQAISSQYDSFEMCSDSSNWYVE